MFPSGKQVVISLTLCILCQLARAQSDAPRRSSDESLLRGVEYLQESVPDKAKECLEQALAENPGNDAAHYYLGYVAAQSNDAAAAVEHFGQAYKMDSGNVWYAKRYASLCALTGKTDEALGLYELLCRKHSYDIEMLFALTDLYMGSEAYEKADSLVDRIDILQGESAFTRMIRVDIHRSTGEISAMFDDLDVLFSDPSVSSATKEQLFRQQYGMGSLRFNQEHIADYDRLISTGLLAHPGDTVVTHLAANYYYSTERPDEVVTLYKRYPRDIQLGNLAVFVSQQSGNAATAMECSRILEDVCRDDAESLSYVYTARGDLYQSLGKKSKAYSCYDRALRLKPDNLQALNNYAYYMSCNGRNLKRCEQMAAQVILADSENVTYLDTYAWVLYKLGRLNEARSLFKKIMSMGGKESAEVLLHYAEVLDSCGDKTLAEAYRHQAEIRRNEDTK